MLKRTSRVALALAVVCAGVSLAYAANPTFWQVSNEAEFSKGDVENLSIDGYGRLTLGPSTTSVYDATAPFLWSMISAPDGSMYVGSGNEGQVYRIDASGKGSVFFDAEELEVHAMALAPGGGLYAATSPEGKIYKIDAAGKSSVLFDPPDKYIWGLAVDRAGNVFAATGDKGVVYKITPDGKGSVFYQTKTTHAISLALESDGHVLVGTESPGRLFRLDANGKPFVLLDSPYNEIHTLKIDPKGIIYAAAVSGSGGSNTPPPPTTPEPAQAGNGDRVGLHRNHRYCGSGTAASVRGNDVGARTPEHRRVRRRRVPDYARRRMGSHLELPRRFALRRRNRTGWNVIVATGNKGKIYRLSGDPLQPTLLTRATAQQVTALIRDNEGRVTFSTSNPGKVMRLSQTRADRGTYVSDVRDAQTIATWGAIRWQAGVPQGTRVEISTRSGNTRTPDETWSDWTVRLLRPGRKPHLEPSRPIPAVARGVDREARETLRCSRRSRPHTCHETFVPKCWRSRSILRARFSSVRSRLAILKSRDLMAMSPAATPTRRREEALAARTSAAVRIRKASSPSPGAHRMKTATSSSTTSSIDARARRHGSR
jgi:hypothetical protein